MRKWLFNIGATASAILLAVFATLWIRGDDAVLVMRPCAHLLTQNDGRFEYDRIRFADWTSSENFMPWYLRFVAENTSRDSSNSEPGLFGIELWSGNVRFNWAPNNWSPQPVDLNVFHIGVPRLLALSITALLPVIASARFVITAMKRARRRARGQCLGCGYDLRASHDECPECGQKPGKLTRSVA